MRRRPVLRLAALAAIAGGLVVTLLPAAAGATAPPSPLWGTLESGPHAVGFQVLERRDPSRPFRYPFDLDGNRRQVDVARPLQVGVWYPAQASTGTTMRLGDYVALMGGEQDFTLAVGERARRGEAAYFAFEVVRPATPEQRAQLLALPTAARRDAAPAAGKFPVILWSLGSPALYQASAEHLASHGYVVAILPRVPATLSFGDNAPTRADYDAKSRDLDFLLAEVARLPFADVAALGVTGFSAGGRWAIGEAMRNPAVRAVVSQDSILLFGDDGAAQHAAMPYHAPERVRAPVLHMIRREWVPQESGELWTAMRNAERTKLVFEASALHHLDFASLGYASTLVGLRPEAKETVAQAFVAWQRATLWFFDAHLRGDAAARVRVAALPASLGLPEKAVTAERLAGAAGTIDERQLGEALVEDFAAALPRARQLLAAGHGAPDVERALNLSGYTLLAVGRTADALALFTLNAESFAGSANVWDSLADGYEATGARDQALAASRKALDLLAADTTTPPARRDAIRRSAEQRLERLQRPHDGR
jgi:dienelactone hydrolase